MKLDSLTFGAFGQPLIRLFDFTAEEAHQFQVAVGGLAAGTTERVEVHQLPFVYFTGDRLTLVRRKWGQGVLRANKLCEFECGLTAGAWDNIAGLVEPFTKNAKGFQWLDGGPEGSAAALLFSPTGEW